MKRRIGVKLATWIVLIALATGGAWGIARYLTLRGEREHSSRLAKASLAELRKITEERDWDSEAFYWLGTRLTDAGQNADAVKALARSAALDPKAANAMGALGLALARSDRPQEAESVLLQALTLDPNSESINFTLGNLYGKYKRMEKAQKAFEATVKINPKNTEAQYLLGYCYGELFQEDKKLAILEGLVKALPDDVRVLKSLGYVYLFFGKFSQAVDIYRHTLLVAPNDLETRYLLGRAIAEQANSPEAFAEAERELVAVRKAAPENPGVHLALGILHFRRGEFAKAIPELDIAIKSGIREHKTWLYLGQSYQRVGNATKAKEYLSEFENGTRLSRQVSQLENRLQNTPDTPENRKEIIEVRIRLIKVYIADKNFNKAMNNLNILQEHDPNNPVLESLKKQCDDGIKKFGNPQTVGGP